MAPILYGNEKVSTFSSVDDRGTWGIDANAIAIVASFTMIFAALFAICGCCGGSKDADKKKKDAGVEPPRYLEMDVDPKVGGKKTSPDAAGPRIGEASMKSKKEKGSPDEPKKVAYVELEPPPLVPFKSDTVLPNRTQVGGASSKPNPDVKTGKDASEKPNLKKTLKGKDADDPMQAFSVVKKGSTPSTPSAAPKGKDKDLQFVREDDPRYRSLAHLDDMFEGTQMKQSVRTKGAGKSVRTADASASRTAKP